MEPLTRDIDRLQALLDEAMKKRLGMITRQVAQVHRMEEELQVTKRQLDTFDRLYGMGGPSSPTIPRNSILEKDFECPVCYEVMSPPSRIFQCSNGHLICEECKQRQEIRSCPTCRVPLGPSSLLRNIPLEKLAKTYFERCPNSPISSSRLLAPAFALEAASRASSRRSSVSRQQTISQGSPSWPHDDMDSKFLTGERRKSPLQRKRRREKKSFLKERIFGCYKYLKNYKISYKLFHNSPKKNQVEDRLVFTENQEV